MRLCNSDRKGISIAGFDPEMKSLETLPLRTHPWLQTDRSISDSNNRAVNTSQKSGGGVIKSLCEIATLPSLLPQLPVISRVGRVYRRWKKSWRDKLWGSHAEEGDLGCAAIWGHPLSCYQPLSLMFCEWGWITMQGLDGAILWSAAAVCLGHPCLPTSPQENNSVTLKTLC